MNEIPAWLQVTLTVAVAFIVPGLVALIRVWNEVEKLKLSHQNSTATKDIDSLEKKVDRLAIDLARFEGKFDFLAPTILKERVIETKP